MDTRLLLLLLLLLMMKMRMLLLLLLLMMMMLLLLLRVLLLLLRVLLRELPLLRGGGAGAPAPAPAPAVVSKALPRALPPTPAVDGTHTTPPLPLPRDPPPETMRGGAPNSPEDAADAATPRVGVHAEKTPSRG